MKLICNVSLILSMLACAHSALAQEGAAQDGVKVGSMSVLRKLVPSGALEGQAAQQYQQTMQAAQQQNALLPANHPQVLRLQAIAKKIIPYALPWNDRAKNWKWQVNVIASKEVNAYCMPGGKIAFYTGILDTLKLTDDEVAMIMGHEIAHALREHGAERAGKGVLANMAVRGLAMFAESKGYDPQAATALGGLAANGAMLKFSRDDETESDIVGLDIAARAGYDPRAGVALWQKMGMVNKNAPPKWFSTHPPGNDRIAEIRKHFVEVMPLYARAKGVKVNALPPYRSNVEGIAPIN